MKTNIFIPQKINVGFQERSDTYTQKLSYIIYFDEKGVLRKEKSWDGWRDKKIDNEIHANEPTSGFVLNKKAGGYSSGWNHRQTYVRVYDPRGFEFEITVPNLLYILENTSSIKGKGLEGEFVYGWEGKDLVLVPVDSPDYIEITKLNEIIFQNNFIKPKDLIVGATYLTKDNEEYIYIGKFEEYGWRGEKKKGKSFFFAQRYIDKYSKDNATRTYFKTMRTLSKKFISCVSEDSHEEYASIFDELEHDTIYSPVDESKDEYVPFTLEEIEAHFNNGGYWLYVHTDVQGVRERTEISFRSEKPSYYLKESVTYNNGWYGKSTTYNESVRKNADSIEEIFNILKPMKRRQFLANGKLYSEGN